VDVYSALGHLQFELGRFDAAAEAYRQVSSASRCTTLVTTPGRLTRKAGTPQGRSRFVPEGRSSSTRGASRWESESGCRCCICAGSPRR
jgi:hypothetical protein